MKKLLSIIFIVVAIISICANVVTFVIANRIEIRKVETIDPVTYEKNEVIVVRPMIVKDNNYGTVYYPNCDEEIRLYEIPDETYTNDVIVYWWN